MMHTWTEQHADTFAISGQGIVDCVHIDAALVGFLDYCNISLVEPYPMMWEGLAHGRV